MKDNRVILLRKRITEALASDGTRQRLIFIIINILLTIVAFGMTVVNAFTSEKLLFCVTLLFSILCAINAIFVIKNDKIERAIHIIFSIESLILIGFFAISGIPDGFSIQWICLIPGFAFLVFNTSYAKKFSFVAFGMLAFLFWVPVGRDLLMYPYNDTFMLRFPFYYLAILLLSYITDKIRENIKQQLDKTKEDYYHLYRHDYLTGIYNRFGIKSYLDSAMNFENSDHVAILVMDIDDFKWINDTYGHQCGDHVLKNIADISVSLMCEHSKVCRWGGEEFLIVMGCEHDPMVLAETIRKEVENTKTVFEDKAINVTVSFGVAIVSSDDKEGTSKIIEKADRALYKSKARGKNCVTLYNSGQE